MLEIQHCSRKSERLLAQVSFSGNKYFTLTKGKAQDHRKLATVLVITLEVRDPDRTNPGEKSAFFMTSILGFHWYLTCSRSDPTSFLEHFK